jgi:chromosomal replication initiator protein
MNKTAQSVWKTVCLLLKTTFKIKPTKLGLNQSNQLNLPIMHYIFKFLVNFLWLEEHYVKLLKVALTKELGKNAKLLYKIKMENTYGNKQPFTEQLPSAIGLNETTKCRCSL